MRIPKLINRSLAAISPLVAMIVWLPCMGQTLPRSTLERLNEFALVREYGIKRRADKLPRLITLLEAERLDSNEPAIVLSAIGRMANDAALPSLERWLQKYPSHGRARIARARILANSASAGIENPQERAKVRVARFLSELELSVSAINSGLAATREFRTHGDTRLELVVLRTIADMVYRIQDPALKLHVGQLGLNFGADPISALKLDLSLLTTHERIERLTSRAASLRVLSWEYMFVQLLADEGPEAGDAAVRKLSEMAADPRSYTQIGFRALILALRALGNPDHLGVVQRFMKEPDGGVNGAQLAYMTLSRGLRTTFGEDF